MFSLTIFFPTSQFLLTSEVLGPATSVLRIGKVSGWPQHYLFQQIWSRFPFLPIYFSLFVFWN